MSQTEEKEENVNTERAVEFFGALFDYFKENPKTATGLLHILADDVINTIIGNEELRKELGFQAGRLEITSSFIWYHDDSDAIQEKLANPDTLNDVMDAIAKLARAYSKLKGGETVSLQYIQDLIKGAASNLYEILVSIISGGSDP
jgi:hypothetical protein